MSATGFFHDNSNPRDRTLVRDEPPAGVEAPEKVWDKKFYTIFEPGSDTAWFTVEKELVEDLDGGWR